MCRSAPSMATILVCVWVTGCSQSPTPNTGATASQPHPGTAPVDAPALRPATNTSGTVSSQAAGQAYVQADPHLLQVLRELVPAQPAKPTEPPVPKVARNSGASTVPSQPIDPSDPYADVPSYDYSKFDGSRRGMYSTDKDDVKEHSAAMTFALSPESALKPVGGLADIVRVIDHKGFVPLSLISKAKRRKQDESPLNFFMDVYEWYAVPTPDAVAILYFGINHDRTMPKRIKVIPESRANAQDAKWTRVAEELALKHGSELYKKIGGGAGLQAAEPVCTILTDTNALVILNFRYGDLDRRGTGQALASFEFSRTTFGYRSAYLGYHTFSFSPDLKNAFQATYEIVVAAMKAIE
jgi:hypothetical protein